MLGRARLRHPVIGWCGYYLLAADMEKPELAPNGCVKRQTLAGANAGPSYRARRLMPGT